MTADTPPALQVAGGPGRARREAGTGSAGAARRVTGPLRALLALGLLALLGAAASAQGGEPIHVTSLGNQLGFADPEDPERVVWTFLGGVEVRQGQRLLLARQLVLVLRAGAGEEAPAAETAGFVVPGSRVLELFLEGDVTLEEGDERIVGAETLYLDNTTGLMSLERGTWRVADAEEVYLIHFESMRRLADGTRELRGVRATTCTSCDPDWALTTARATLQDTAQGEVLHTAGNLVEVGGLPVFWLPGVHLNVEQDRPPLKRVEFGSSTRFGTEIATVWGGDADEVMTRVARALGAEGPVDGEWGFTLANYSDRGVFYEPVWTYSTPTSKGRLFGAFIDDDEDSDFNPTALEDVEDPTRGRIDLEHRTRLDDDRVVDVELSYLTDAGFLPEYYENESRVGKEQETYVNYRDVDGNEAFQVLARGRLNDFQSQVEYLPRVEWRNAGQQIDAGPLGEPFFSSVSFADAVRLAAADDPTLAGPQPDSFRNTRAGTRGELTWPFDLANGDRVQLMTGYDLTFFENSVEQPDDPTVPADTTVLGGSDVRTALDAGVEWSRTYSGTGDFQSRTWNFDGVRQIVEPHAGYTNLFLLDDRPDDLVGIDQVETLDRVSRFDVGVRHRVQTHQDGQVKTILDTDVSVPFYPDEDRDNEQIDFTTPDGDGDPDTVGPPVLLEGEGRTTGNLLVDMRWTPGANISFLRDAMVRWRATLDPNGWGYVRSFASYETALGENKRFMISENKAEHASNFLSTGVEWVLTSRWSGAVFYERDQRDDEVARRGVLVRQTAECWIMDLELSRRRGRDLRGAPGDKDREETRVSLRFWPRVGGRVEQESLLQTIGRVR